MHLHLSLIHALVTLCEIMLALIPLKLISANFVGRHPLADAIYAVL
jgi:hypothetical protein